MKTVFSNHMVAHVWAQQNQATGRSANGNFRFEGGTLYSYRTPIANIVKNHRGESIALLTTRSYSVTTSGKHMRPAHRAVSHLTNYAVPFIGEYGGRGPSAESLGHANYHQGNLNAWSQDYIDARAKMMGARGRYYGDTPSHLLSILNDARSYCQSFGLVEPDWISKVDPVADWRDAVARWDRLEAADKDPATLAKREKERQRREARKAEKQREAEAEAREAFRAGNWHSALRSLPVMLRVDGDEIVTSHGARFPVEHGKRAFKAIVAIKASGQGWETNGKTIPLGHFKVDRVSPDGEVRAGCHVVAWPEIEHCAASLGLVE